MRLTLLFAIILIIAIIGDTALLIKELAPKDEAYETCHVWLQDPIFKQLAKSDR